MKYYAKHLRRIIRQKPLQPLLMLFILLLSFLVENTAMSAAAAVSADMADEHISAYGSAELAVSVGSDSPCRFLTERAVTDVLPEAEVTGSFTLPFLLEDELVTGYAVDFTKADSFFDFAFTERMTVRAKEKKTSVFLTERLAREWGICLGDTVTFSLFGTPTTYTVVGLSDTPFLGNADAVCDISGILPLLTGKSEFLSVLAEDVAVYGKLYVRHASMSGEEMKAALAPALGAYSMTVTDRGVTDNSEANFRGVSFVLLLFCFIISLAVLTGCSYCMSKQREEFTALFCLVGFSKRKTYFLRVAELLFYALVAIGLGCLLSYPIGEAMYRAMGLNFERFHLTFLPVFCSCVSLFSVCFLSPLMAERKDKKATGKSPSVLFGLCVLAAAVSFLILTFIVPVSVAFYPSILGIVSTVLAFALLTEPVMALFAKNAGKKSRPIARLAGKNCLHVGELTNSCRLLVVLLTVLSTVSYLVVGVSFCFPIFENVIAGEYVVAGANAQAKEILLSLDEVEDVYSVRVANAWTAEDGQTMHAWGIDSMDVFSYGVECDTLPAAGEILCCNIMREGYDLPLGTPMTVREGDTDMTFVISRSVKGVVPLFLTTCDSIGEGTDYFVVKGKDGVSDADLYSAVTEALSAHMVTVLPSSSLMDYYLNNDRKYMCFCEILLVVFAVFGALGIANNIGESLRSRKEELTSFAICGMTRRQIRRMLWKEGGRVFFVAGVLGVVGFGLLFFLSNNGLKSYATDMAELYRVYFGLGR